MSPDQPINEAEESVQYEPAFVQPKRKRRSKWRYLLYFIVICFLSLASMNIKAAISSDESFWEYLLTSPTSIIKPPAFLTKLSGVNPLVNAAEVNLKGIKDDRVNILLMGIGGRGHAGRTLTDTMILVSYKPSTKDISMMSIPRDLLVPIPGYGWRKINHVYALSSADDPDTSGEFTTEVLGDIFKQEIPYFVVIDFDAFSEIIDLVGGVDIQVPQTLSDYRYPVAGKEEAPDDQRYEHLYIEEGLQHLDGSTALKYARSRHALGQEGSDFARAARQQLMLEALKNKLISFSTIFNPGKIKKILGNLQDNVDTNLNLNEMMAFTKIAYGYDSETNAIKSVVLDDRADGPLRANSYNGSFVLEPRYDDYSEIKFITANIFETDPVYVVPTRDTSIPEVQIENPVVSQETARIEIQNGTFVNGLAGANKQTLVDLGYEVVKVGNADKQNYRETIIYDLTDTPFPKTESFLAENFSSNIQTSIPLGISSTADYLIVLGLDLAY